MAVLSDQGILKALKSNVLVIRPFYRKSLQPASYDMRLYWKILVSSTRYETGREINLRKETQHKLAVEPGCFVAVLTLEELVMPLWISGRFGLKSEFTRQGLVAFPGIQVDPGFRGRLAISLFHAGPEPIDLILNKPMFTVEFHTLDTPAAKGYQGPFQNQMDFPDIQREFILTANTVSLSEIRRFPGELAALARRLARHEAGHPPLPPAGTIAELARAQGVKPIDNLTELAGIWPADEDIDEFIQAVRRWRRKST